jgi:hypothetical protein
LPRAGPPDTLPDHVSPVTPVRGLSAVLIAALGLLPLVPPAHVHDAVDEAGHHGRIAHRHTAAHHAAEPLPLVDGREPTHVEDAESVVSTLDPVFIGSPDFTLRAPALPAETVILAPDVAPTATRDPFVERQIHGPPRAPTLLRGPPVLS